MSKVSFSHAGTLGLPVTSVFVVVVCVSWCLFSTADRKSRAVSGGSGAGIARPPARAACLLLASWPSQHKPDLPGLSLISSLFEKGRQEAAGLQGSQPKCSKSQKHGAGRGGAFLKQVLGPGVSCKCQAKSCVCNRELFASNCRQGATTLYP